MKNLLVRCFCACALLTGASSAFAQSQPIEEMQEGFSGYEAFQGSTNSASKIFKLDSNVGYDFNKHFGMFAGVPLYFANVQTVQVNGTTSTATSTTNNGLGNIYAGFAMRAPSKMLDYESEITLGAPTGSRSKGFSSGRANVDWNNRFEHSFDRLTPFFEGGLSNSVPDSRLVTRQFTSLGMLTHLEEGGEFELAKYFSVGGSGYEIVPFGNQKIYSKLVGRSQTVRTRGKNSFNQAAFSSGNGLTRENGFNGWVAFDPTPVWRLELGFSRSATFDVNSFAFNLRMNLGKLARQHRNS